MAELVFVYGSLKQGYFNNRLFDHAEGELLGKGKTMSMYSLYNLGAYPGVWIDNPVSPIYGEVYTVPTLDRLDTLEGYPNYYNRQKVLVEILTPDLQSAGYVKTSWMYYLNPYRNHQPDPQRLIASGTW